MMALKGDIVVPWLRWSNMGGLVLGVGCSDPLHALGDRRLVRSKEWQNVPLLPSPLTGAPEVAVLPKASYLQAIFIFSSGGGAG